MSIRIAALLAFSLSLPAFAAGDIVLLHTNDTHGQLRPTDAPEDLGGVARRSTLLSRERARAEARGDHVLLLDAGDVITGTYMSDQAKGMLDVKAMNALGYDAVAVGNHEFDLMEPEQARFMAAANFPFLSANVRSRKLRRVFPSHIVKRVGEHRVAIIGLTTPETPATSTFGRSYPVRFEDPGPELGRVLRRIEGEVDVVVVLTHLGGGLDYVLMKEFDGRFHAWIGGHDHSQVGGVRHDGSAYSRAGSKGRWLGRLTLHFDGKGRFRKAQPEFLPVDSSLPEDPEIDALLPATEQKEAMGFATAMLAKIGAHGLMGSSSLGNLLADALRSEGDVDIAVTNRGGIRRDLPEGPIDGEQLHGVSPFRNLFFKYRLSGSQVRAVFQEAYRLGPASNGFLEISGATVRLSRGGVRVEIDGEPIRDDASYTLGVSDFLAGGGDGYTVFADFPAPEVVDRPPSDMLQEHVKKVVTIRPDTTPRLRFEAPGREQ